jgi:predicted ATP-grasp superfamily ATP-dependent carboligase
VKPAGHKVLVLGNDDRVILAVVRSLGRQELQVHVAWCDPKLPAMSSRYLYAYHELPAYSACDETWIIALNRLVASHDYDLIIPCNDFAVVPLQLFRDRLTPSGNWYLLNEASFQMSFNKHRTSQLARKLGIPTPREIHVGMNMSRLQDDGDDTSWMTELCYPVYIKPHSSVTRMNVMNKRSVQRATDLAELRNVLTTLQNPNGLLIQERFCGEGHGVEVLAFEGAVLFEMQHRRLRETISGGSTYRETVQLNPHLREAVAAMVAELSYTGVAMFEFRVNPQTGRYVLLEINARLWGSLPLAIVAGADFPFYLYQMLVCGRRIFPDKYKTGVRCRNLLPDLRCIKSTFGVTAAVWHLFTMFFRTDHQDHWAWDDRKPQLRLFLDSIRSFIRNHELSIVRIIRGS